MQRRISPVLGLLGNREGKTMAKHPNVTRINDAYAAFAKGDFAVLEDFFARTGCGTTAGGIS